MSCSLSLTSAGVLSQKALNIETTVARSNSNWPVGSPVMSSDTRGTTHRQCNRFRPLSDSQTYGQSLVCELQVAVSSSKLAALCGGEPHPAPSTRTLGTWCPLWAVPLPAALGQPRSGLAVISLRHSHLHLQQLPPPRARSSRPGELAFLNPKTDLGVMSRGMPTGQPPEREIKDV